MVGFIKKLTTPRSTPRGESKAASKKGESVVPATIPEAGSTVYTDEQEAAAAKLQAVKRGNKARFAMESESEAAKKIQSFKRGQDLRRNQGGAPAPLNRQLSRRVSFSGSQWPGMDGDASPGILDQLTAALKTCMSGMPCLAGQQPGRKPSLPKDATNSPLAPPKAKPAEPQAEDADKKAELSPAVLEKVTSLFKKLDNNGDGTVTKSEAQVYWKANWSKVNASAMFNEVDDDGNGEVTYEEWVEFWRNVLAQPDYSEEEVSDELDNMLQGGSWVDWNDGRTT